MGKTFRRTVIARSMRPHISPPLRALSISKRDLQELGGWKTPKTLTDVYLLAEEDAQRRALEGG